MEGDSPDTESIFYDEEIETGSSGMCSREDFFCSVACHKMLKFCLFYLPACNNDE